MSGIKTSIPGRNVFIRMGAAFALCVIAGASTGCGIAATGSTGEPEIRITKFVIEDVEGVIDQKTKTITLTLPFEAGLFGHNPQIDFFGADIKPPPEQPQDFDKPVIYTVYSKDTSTFPYTVTVNLEIPDTKEIRSFSLAGAAGIITEQSKSAGEIRVTVPYGTDLSNRTASIGHNGAWIEPDPGAPRNFNSPVTYTVVSGQDNRRRYTVFAAAAGSNQHDIISFKIRNALGVIAGNSITVTVPFGMGLAALIPEIALSAGAQLDPPSGKMMNFTQPVSYKVTPASGSEIKIYTVTVKAAAISDKSIESFVIAGQKSSVITETDSTSGTITVTLPANMPNTNLAPRIAFRGSSLTPESGAAKDFVSSQTYTVTAADGTVKRYMVSVNYAPVETVWLESVTADGESFKTATTALVLTFNKDMGGALEAQHIGLSTSESITKGTLARTGAGVYLLNVSGISSNNALVTVSLTSQPYGYSVSNSKQTRVYKEATRVTWNSLTQDGGVDGTTTTRGLLFVFDKDITGLTESDISLTGASKGALSGSGKNYALTINGISANKTVVSAGLSKTSSGEYTFAPVTMSVTVYKQQNAEAGMIAVTGNSFAMGSSAHERDRRADEIQHQVTLHSFTIGNILVTQKRWKGIMGESNNPSTFKGDDLPVEKVSWFDAVMFCNGLSDAEGFEKAYAINGTNVTWNRNANGYRLPTEAEWEYACRAGTVTPYSTGDTLTTAQANYKNSSGATTPPGTYPPNNWGIYDMHGNVYEWCWDWYNENYYQTTEAQTNPAGPDSGTTRVLRGGSAGDNYVTYLRSASRASTEPEKKIDAGFRIARNNEPCTGP